MYVLSQNACVCHWVKEAGAETNHAPFPKWVWPDLASASQENHGVVSFAECGTFREALTCMRIVISISLFNIQQFYFLSGVFPSWLWAALCSRVTLAYSRRWLIAFYTYWYSKHCQDEMLGWDENIDALDACLVQGHSRHWCRIRPQHPNQNLRETSMIRPHSFNYRYLDFLR